MIDAATERLYQLVACPTCGAPPLDKCSSSKGSIYGRNAVPAYSHKKRKWKAALTHPRTFRDCNLERLCLELRLEACEAGWANGHD